MTRARGYGEGRTNYEHYSKCLKPSSQTNVLYAVVQSENAVEELLVSQDDNSIMYVHNNNVKQITVFRLISFVRYIRYLYFHLHYPVVWSVQGSKRTSPVYVFWIFVYKLFSNTESHWPKAKDSRLLRRQLANTII